MVSSCFISCPFLKTARFFIKSQFRTSFTLNVPFGYFINDTSMTSVGNKHAVNKAIINDVEQTMVTT